MQEVALFPSISAIIMIFAWAKLGHKWLSKKKEIHWWNWIIAGPLVWIAAVVFVIDEIFD